MREGALYSRPPCPVEAGLSLALCFEQDRVESLAGGLTGPDHELERLEISLAGFDRDPQHGFALSVGRISSARQQQGMAEHHHVFRAPQVEMPDPELLVDGGDELEHL